MRIIDFYNKRFVANMPPDRFGKVLTGADEEITVRVLGNGSMLLSNSKVIKCVSNYYDTIDDKKLPSSAMVNSQYLHCINVRKIIGCDSIVDRMDCKFCHLNCLRLVLEKKLKRKK